MFIRAALVAVVVLFGLFSPDLEGQSPSVPPPPEIIDETISFDVDLVDVYFTAREKNQLVRQLNQDEFKVFEDGREQQIRYFTADSQQPLSLAILVDSSTSQEHVLDKQLDVGRHFLQQVLRPGDEAMVLGFDSRLQVQQEFTHSPDQIAAALERALKGTTASQLESGNLPPFRSTALYDAIVAIATRRMRQRHGHKVILILTDGQDIRSRNSAKQAVEAAERTDAGCYVLLIGDKNEMASTSYKGIDRMLELTRATGGRMILVGKDPLKLQKSFDEISEELRHLYTLSYSPDRKEKKGEYRQIKVKSQHGYKLQARKGYYATPNEKKPELEARH